MHNIKSISSFLRNTLAFLLLLGTTSGFCGEWRYVDFPLSWSPSKGWVFSFPVDGGVWEQNTGTGEWEFLGDPARIISPESIEGRIAIFTIPDAGNLRAFAEFSGEDLAIFFNARGGVGNSTYTYTKTGPRIADLLSVDGFTRESYALTWTGPQSGTFTVRVEYVGSGLVENHTGSFQFID